MIQRLSHIRALILLMAVTAALSLKAQDADMKVTATADSATLVMGDRTTVNVEVIKNGHAGAMIDMPEKEKDYYGMEMADCAVDSTDLGNGRVKLNYHFTFQAFEPNDLVTLPPFRYVVGADTLASDILTFKVLPVDLSPELGDPANPDSLTIHPDEGILSVKSKWYDYIPDWTIWALVGVLVAALLVVLYLLYKKNGPKLFVPRKPVPPYELALQKLSALRKKKLIETGQAKQFYTEVTDIWRSYLEGRFGISAMEMTSSQIIEQLRKNEETHLSADQMKELLEMSDFVKFAAMSPSSEEMVKTFNTIYSFIESTRPKPEDEAKDAEDTKSKKK